MSKTTNRAPRPRAKRQPFGRNAWLEAARDALIEEGTRGVDVKKLAKRVGAPSRGGFYWFFRSRQHLLDELLEYWARTSTVMFERVVPGRVGHGMEEYLALIRMWIDENEYDPRWDGAMRDWGRTSPAVQKVVHAVDDRRIAIIEKLFFDIGYKGKDANIRARVMYYHQVGYYAMGVRESRKQRVELIPYYRRVLTGFDP